MVSPLGGVANSCSCRCSICCCALAYAWSSWARDAAAPFPLGIGGAPGGRRTGATAGSGATLDGGWLGPGLAVGGGRIDRRAGVGSIVFFSGGSPLRAGRSPEPPGSTVVAGRERIGIVAAIGACLRRLASSVWVSGRPPVFANCCCWTAKSIGAGGGACTASTGRRAKDAGGNDAWRFAAASPIKLTRVGTTGARSMTRTRVNSPGATRIAERPTGVPFTNVFRETTVTAFATVRLRYVTLVTLVTLTFVMLMLVMFTLVTFTRRKYTGLTVYGGR